MRGLTAGVVDQARSLLDALTKVAPSTLPVSPPDAKAELSRTEEHAAVPWAPAKHRRLR